LDNDHAPALISRIIHFATAITKPIGPPTRKPTRLDGRPILAFEAGGHRDAQQICKEAWLHDDLAELKSGGIPFYTVQSESDMAFKCSSFVLTIDANQTDDLGGQF
jgi:hypothetical protein